MQKQHKNFMKCEERKLWSEMQMALKTVVFTVVDHAKRQTEASCQEVIKKKGTTTKKTLKTRT